MSVTAPPARPEALATPRRWRSAAFWHRLVRLASLALIVVALALTLLRGQGEAVPVALAGLVLGWLVIARFFRGSEQSFLLTLFLAGLAVRLLAAVLVHPYLVSRLVTGSRDVTYIGFMFEDDRVFDNVAWALARTWAGVIPGVDRNDGYLINNYTYFTGLLYYLLGHELLAAKFFNCFVGAILPVATFALGRELGGDRVGRLAALAAAIFPSLALWSILNLKDPLVTLLLTIAMFWALRFARAPSLAAAALVLTAFALIENLRLYVFFLLGWLIPLTFFVVNRSPRRRRLAVGIPFTIAVLSVVAITNQSQWLGLRFLTDKRFEALDSSRAFGAATAETGIEIEKVPRSEGGWAIQAINAPRVLPYVLFAPFPWAARRPRDFAVIPETLAWYAIEALVLLTIVVYGRKRWRDFFLLVGYGGGMVVIGSIIEGNVGTIYRHRAMLLPSAFVMAGLGLTWLQARWWPRGVRLAGDPARERGLESGRTRAEAVS